MTWKPTLKENQVQAQLIDGAMVSYAQLRCGDIFRPVRNGEYVNPFTFEPDSSTFAICTSDATKNDDPTNPFGLDPPCTGYCVEIVTGPWAEIVRGKMH